MMKTRTKHRSRAHKIIPGILLSLLSVIGCAWGTLNGPGSSTVSTPTGGVLVTAINKEATKVWFDLDKEYTGEWKVYTEAEGGAALTTVSADTEIEDGKVSLVLESADGPIAPRTYYVSLKREGKAESNRFALWGGPLVDPNPMSLAKRFRLAERGYGIPDALPVYHGGTEIDGVSAVFNLLHGYLQDVRNSVIPNTTDPLKNYKVPGILLGDWVDLPSLTLEGYPNISDQYPGAAESYYPLNLTNVLIPDGRPLSGTPLLRLIVVGNNSFHSRGTYWLSDENARKYNDATPHLVFQFQNVPTGTDVNYTTSQGQNTAAVPGTASMNDWSGATNTGGYGASGMRKYLTPVSGVDGSGRYLAGLTGAGVPESVLFAPKRYVANGSHGDANKAEEIQDLVWLPTMREMTGGDFGANTTYETEANQARLEYYDTNDKREKGRIWTTAYRGYFYWTASPSSGSRFCIIYGNGSGTLQDEASQAHGVAPAFCVW
jgi:hypothetical protein